MGHVIDIHEYEHPKSPYPTSRAAVLGEYGGLGYLAKGHAYNESAAASYKMFKTAEALQVDSAPFLVLPATWVLCGGEYVTNSKIWGRPTAC